MNPIKYHRFTHTAEALRLYDEARPIVLAAFSEAETNEAVDAAKKTDQDLINAIKEAFYLDTQGINSRDRAMLITVEDARQFVQRDQSEEA